MTPLCPRSNDPPMFVSDLIHAATRPWNMEVVREHMYEMDAEAVANIPISHVAQPERMEEDSHKIGIINKNKNESDQLCENIEERSNFEHELWIIMRFLI